MRKTAGLWCLGLVAGLISGMAAAEAPLPPPSSGLLVEPEPLERSSPASARESEVMRITVSRASDLVGRPMFPDRTAVATTATQVAFSDHPIVALTGAAKALGRALPLRNGRLTSGFGYRRHPIAGGWRIHSGVDLAAPLGTPVRATQAGQVRSAAWRGGYGLLVTLEHGGGLETRYGHLSRISVRPGQAIGAGELVGYVGSTGNSTGPHLHYETRVNGRAYDPAAR